MVGGWFSLSMSSNFQSQTEVIQTFQCHTLAINRINDVKNTQIEELDKLAMIIVIRHNITM